MDGANCNIFNLSLVIHGTLEWDGQWGLMHGGRYRLGHSQPVPSYQWYIGMGWTLGIYAWWRVQVGIFPTCPFLPVLMVNGASLDAPSLLPLRMQYTCVRSQNVTCLTLVNSMQDIFEMFMQYTDKLPECSNRQ